MKDVYRTSTGIEIGCMYQKPLPQMNSDEEEIQRALLGMRGPDQVSIALYIIFLVVLFITLALTVGSGR
tara:strand:+ start:208 stop:414 length:207 start_codon:yes stop_codon:yes gene_type:complete